MSLRSDLKERCPKGPRDPSNWSRATYRFEAKARFLEGSRIESRRQFTMGVNFIHVSMIH